MAAAILFTFHRVVKEELQAPAIPHPRLEVVEKSLYVLG
jgi:hypothetical protein